MKITLSVDLTPAELRDLLRSVSHGEQLEVSGSPSEPTIDQPATSAGEVSPWLSLIERMLKDSRHS